MNDQPQQEAAEPQAAADDCEHHYETRILGGHPLHVRACTFCRIPDWADLYEQADALYRWGREEALAGKPARERLTAYDMPREDDDRPQPPAHNAGPTGIRGLLEHVGIDTTGRDITVAGRVVDPAPAPAPATTDDCCGSEPPADGTWGDCWCTLPPGHDGEHRCEPCTDRHGAPGWTDQPARNAGPSVRECAEADARWWADKYAGEGQ